MNNFLIDGNIYTLETRTCNKPVCKCHNGQPHGPYWYRNHTHYIGKELPPEITRHTQAMKAIKIVAIKKKILLEKELLKLKTECRRKEEAIRAIESGLYGGWINEDAETYLRQQKLSVLIPPKPLEAKQEKLDL